MSHIPPPPKLPSSFPSSEPEDSGDKENFVEPVNISNHLDAAVSVEEKVSSNKHSELETVEYAVPKPTVRTITWISTVVGLLVWFAASSVGLVESLQDSGMLQSWIWKPSPGDAASAKIFGIIFLVISFLWSIGMIFAVAIHNIKTLDGWIQAHYGWAMPKTVLFGLGVEEVSGFSIFKRVANYQSVTVDFETPEGVHKVAVVVNDDVPFLFDMNLKQPLVASWDMFKKHSQEEFRRDLWVSKGEIIFSTFTLTLSDSISPAFLVWSNKDVFDKWLKIAMEADILPQEFVEDSFGIGTIENVLSFREKVVLGNNDGITDILFGYNWESNEGLVMDAKELSMFKKEI